MANKNNMEVKVNIIKSFIKKLENVNGNFPRR